MPVHSEQRSVAFSAGEMFALVADIERYPEFLPWCLEAHIRGREVVDGLPVLTAELVIAHGPVKTGFVSRVTLEEPGRISAVSVEKPFKSLESCWMFAPDGEGCAIDFSLSFEMHGLVMRGLMSAVLAQAARKMVSAFEARAGRLYR